MSPPLLRALKALMDVQDDSQRGNLGRRGTSDPADFPYQQELIGVIFTQQS